MFFFLHLFECDVYFGIAHVGDTPVLGFALQGAATPDYVDV